MNVQDKREEKGRAGLGLYVHAPFCSSTCDFCAFYQEKPRKNSIENYLSGLKGEFSLVRVEGAVKTVFVGGGTPGVLSAGRLERLCGLISEAGGAGAEEWSVELAPSEVTAEKLAALREGGVTRVSLGLQTFDPTFLRELGRDHPPEKAERAYDLIRAAGFASVNVDLLFGAPGQDLAAWEEDLRRAVELEPDHLSTYCLTFEEDTALYARLAKGELRIEPEREAAFYELAWEYLPARGWRRYEVSNYARPGHECRHNLNTWRMNEWLGYGPSAASQFGGWRYRNVADLERWTAAIAAGDLPPREEVESLAPADLARDAVLFGLRLDDGFDLGELAGRFGVASSSMDAVRAFMGRLMEEGLAEGGGEAYRLTTRGLILADGIAAELPDFE